MGHAQMNVRTRACSRTFIVRSTQAALTLNIRGKELNTITFWKYDVQPFVQRSNDCI